MRLRPVWDLRDGELGPTDFLAAKKVANGLNRLKLEIEVRFKLDFHAIPQRRLLYWVFSVQSARSVL